MRIIWLIALGLLACQSAADLPLPEEKIVAVLVDIQIAEAALSGLSWENKDSLTGVYYEQAYARSGVRREEFIRSMDVLRTDPVRLERVYGAVTERLDVLRKTAK